MDSPARTPWLARIDPRTLLWVGATLALSLLVGAAVAATVLWRDLMGDAESEVRRLVRLLSQHAARVVEPVDHTLREAEIALLAAGFGTTPMTPQRIHELIRPYATVGPHLLRLAVVDADGVVVGASDHPRGAEAVRYDDASWFGALAAPAAQGQVAFGRPQHSRLSSHLIVPLARGLYDARSEAFLGAVVASLDVQELEASHRSLAFSEAWRLALLREDGTVLSSAAASESPLRSDAEPGRSALLAALNGHESVQWRPPTDEGVLLGLHRVKDWPLIAAVSLDAARVTAHWQRRTLTIAALTLPAAAATVLLTLLAAAAARRARGLSRSLDITHARHRSLVESSPDGILLARDGRIAYANPALLRMARCHDAALLLERRVDTLLDGNGPHHAGSPSAGNEFDRPAPMCAATLEHWLRPLEGTPIEVETVIAPGPPDNDRWLQIVVRDISTRKEAERRLRRSEERYRLMVEGAPDCAFLLLDVDGVIADVSAVAGRTVLGPRESLLGRPLGALFTLEATTADEPTRLLRQVARTGLPVEREGWCRRAGGARFWAQLVLSPLAAEQGEPRGFHMLVRDVSSRKLLQDELRVSRRKLETLALAAEAAREREKVRMARELHDELGQMLTVQQLDVEMLAEELDDAPPAVRERLAAMRAHTDAALETTRRIAGDLRPLVLDDLGLRAALEWLLARARSRCGIDGHLAVRGSTALLCEALSTALFRIAQEGLTNVMRHAQARNVWIELVVGAHAVRLSVADDGCGLPLPPGRRGLGLLGIEERARLLGGHAEVELRAGGGTLIAVELPLVGKDADLASREAG